MLEALHKASSIPTNPLLRQAALCEWIRSSAAGSILVVRPTPEQIKFEPTHLCTETEVTEALLRSCLSSCLPYCVQPALCQLSYLCAFASEHGRRSYNLWPPRHIGGSRVYWRIKGATIPRLMYVLWWCRRSGIWSPSTRV